MIAEILNILTTDTALKALLGATSTDTRIYPYSTDQIDNCITYILSPVSEEDIVRVDQFAVHIVSKDLDNAHAIDSRMRKILKTVGDASNGSFLKVVVNGNGSLEDDATETYHLFTTYRITTKSI
jgi:hypothetical protein